MVDMKDYEGQVTAWCPGCGNFSILKALKTALVKLDIEPHDILMVSGIGQAGKTPHYLKCNCFNGLHGRSLPVATGAKLANHELNVLVVGGDGDGYAEGGNHFLHAMRRNVDVTYMVHDNQVYGLTKGQASPTSDRGFVTKTTPAGVFNHSIYPLTLAVSQDASFAARGFAGDIEHLSKLMVQAIENRGFSYIDILQPCITFNRKNTFAWYKDRVYKLEDHDPWDREAAFKKALEWGDRIPIGVIYRSKRSSFEDRFSALNNGALARQEIRPGKAESLIEEFL